MGIAKSIDPGQPAQSEPADHGQNVSLLADFLCIYPLPNHPKLLTPQEKKAFENIEEKGEIAGNQHFLLFPQCFLLFPTVISISASRLFYRLQML